MNAVILLHTEKVISLQSKSPVDVNLRVREYVLEINNVVATRRNYESKQGYCEFTSGY